MILTEKEREIIIEFEENDSFELKRLMKLGIDNQFQLIKLLSHLEDSTQ